MIHYTSPSTSPVVEVLVDGAVTNRELEDVLGQLRIDLEQNGKTRVLEIIKSFDGIEPAAVWTDLRHGLPMIHKITRVAVVADQKWIRGVTGFARLFTAAEVRTFELAELEPARAWLESA